VEYLKLHYITLEFLEWLKYKNAKPLLYMVYRTRNRKQKGNDQEESVCLE